MQKPKSILIPWYDYPPFSKDRMGGVSVSLWDLSRNLAMSGIPVEFLVPSATDSGDEKSEGLTVRRRDLGRKLVHNKGLDREDRRFFDNYDRILSINNFGASCLNQVNRRDSIIRQVHTIAHDTPIRSYFGLRFSILQYPELFVSRRRQVRDERKLKGVKTICVSKYLSQKMLEFGLESAERLFQVPNGLDTRLFCPKQKEKRYDILFVGRFERAKGLDVLIGALNILAERGKKYRTGIVGNFEGSQKRFCLSLASEKSRQGIEFLGKITHQDLPDTLNSGSLLVSPSRNESFGLAILEAISCGLPIVATKVGGVPEIVDEGVGLLAEPNDSASLARCISQATGDNSLLERALTNGPQRASKYDWSAVTRAFVELL